MITYHKVSRDSEHIEWLWAELSPFWDEFDNTGGEAHTAWAHTQQA